MYLQSTKSFALRAVLCLCLFSAWTLAQNQIRGKRKKVASKRDRIINGLNATIDEFPEIVQLVDINFRHHHECGGFLVSPSHVVTAAHCVTGSAGDGNYLRVIANATYVGEGGVERAIERFYVADKYDSKTKNFDVAVIKLKEPFPIGHGIQVAKLCNKVWTNKDQVRIAGWGLTDPNGNKANRLMKATVFPIADKACKNRLSRIKVGKSGKSVDLHDTLSCTLTKNHVDACVGDSGGPAYLANNRVCGIVSYGFGCARNQLPSFYTSIFKARTFIKQAMKN